MVPLKRGDRVLYFDGTICRDALVVHIFDADKINVLFVHDEDPVRLEVAKEVLHGEPGDECYWRLPDDAGE